MTKARRWRAKQRIELLEQHPRAYALLLEHLPPREARRLKKRGFIRCRSRLARFVPGPRFKIMPRHSYNIGWGPFTGCLTPHENKWIPQADIMLALYLMLKRHPGEAVAAAHWAPGFPE